MNCICFYQVNKSQNNSALTCLVPLLVFLLRRQSGVTMGILTLFILLTIDNTNVFAADLSLYQKQSVQVTFVCTSRQTPNNMRKLLLLLGLWYTYTYDIKRLDINRETRRRERQLSLQRLSILKAEARKLKSSRRERPFMTIENSLIDETH